MTVCLLFTIFSFKGLSGSNTGLGHALVPVAGDEEKLDTGNFRSYNLCPCVPQCFYDYDLIRIPFNTEKRQTLHLLYSSMGRTSPSV